MGFSIGGNPSTNDKISINSPCKPPLRNLNNLVTIHVRKPGPPLSRSIPTCILLNARSLAKPEACSSLYLELNTYNVDVAIVPETWLKPTIPSQAICPHGFTVIRKDRPHDRQGGGVAVFCKNDWKLESLEEFSNPYECLWTKITTNNSIFYLLAIYHPPSPEYQSSDFLDFLTDSCERLLSLEPNAKTDHSWRYQPAGDKATAKLPFFSSDCECSDSWPKDPRCVYNQRSQLLE